MLRRLMPVIILVLLVPVTHASEQPFKAKTKVPNAEALSAARTQCTQLFDHLKAGKTQEISDWIISEVGCALSEGVRIAQRNDFKSKLDLILVGPPASPYGKIDGYDLIDETYLPGSDRYFRYVYITYHQSAPLTWEFRFYVKPDNSVSLNFITWTELNPFKYMSTPDMLLRLWNNN